MQCQCSKRLLLFAINNLHLLKSTNLLAYFFSFITPKDGEQSFFTEQITGIFIGEARDYNFLLYPDPQSICDSLERHMHMKCSHTLFVQGKQRKS